MLSPRPKASPSATPTKVHRRTAALHVQSSLPPQFSFTPPMPDRLTPMNTSMDSSNSALTVHIAPPTPVQVHGLVAAGDCTAVVVGSRVGVRATSFEGMRALKIVCKSAAAYQRKRCQRTETEYRVYRTLSTKPHPFIVKCFGAFASSNAVVLELEICPRGTLRELLHLLPANRLECLLTRKQLAASILAALRHLHMHGIIYRDLKPENVFVRDDGSIALGDFDLAAFLGPEGFAHRTAATQRGGGTHSRSTSSNAAPLSAGMPMRRQSRLSEGGSDTPESFTPNSNFTPPYAQQGTTVTVNALQSNQQTEMASRTPRGKGHRRRDSSNGSSGGGGSRSSAGIPMVELPSPLHAAATVGTSPWPQPAGFAPTVNTARAASASSARRRSSFVGTPYYMPPEVVTGTTAQTAAVDMWSFGALLYEMTYGVTPFFSASEEDTLHKVVHDERIPFPAYPALPRDLRDLVVALLSKDPSMRPTAAEVMEHRWFKDTDFSRLAEVTPPLSAYVSGDDAQAAATQLSDRASASRSAVPARKAAVLVDATPLAGHDEGLFSPTTREPGGWGSAAQQTPLHLPRMDLPTDGQKPATMFDDYVATLASASPLGPCEMDGVAGASAEFDAAILSIHAAFAFFEPFGATLPTLPESETALSPSPARDRRLIGGELLQFLNTIGGCSSARPPVSA
jgi:serine/threonine protein kinase